MCHVLDVSENGYYNWRTRGKSKRKWDDEQLVERIEDAYDVNRGKYGSPRIHAELKAQGIQNGAKTNCSVNARKNLYARRKRRKARTTNSHHQFPIASNLLKRDFTAVAPNKKWVADITFIETQEGWLYLSGVLDIYSRKIVGWAMNKYHNAELVKAALHMAVLSRQSVAGLIHHSDRGSEMESFWATLKEECCGQTIFSTRIEAKAAIFEYIEVYYNRRRIHSSLGYVSPVDYEKQGEQREEVFS